MSLGQLLMIYQIDIMVRGTKTFPNSSIECAHKFLQEKNLKRIPVGAT